MKLGEMYAKDFLKGKADNFFRQNHCDRCRKPIKDWRTTSWFTEDTICNVCGEAERVLKEELRQAGQDTSKLEGCGYIPKLISKDKLP